MKALLILCILFLKINLCAQTNVFPSTGYTGIGTISPEQPLTVVMSPIFNGSGIGVKAINSGGIGSQPAYLYLNPNGVNRMYTYLDVSSDTYNIGNSASSPLFTLLQNGNIGIGTTLPEQRLTVVMDGSENGSGIAVKARNSGGPGSQPDLHF